MAGFGVNLLGMYQDGAGGVYQDGAAGVPFAGPLFGGAGYVPAAAVEPSTESATVYVGNLNWLTTADDLRCFFEGADLGQVYSVDLQKHDDGRSKGWALVEFASLQDAQNCINQLNGARLQDRPMTIRLDRKRYEKQRAQDYAQNMTAFPEYLTQPEAGALLEEKDGEGSNMKTLFVGNLPWEVDDVQLAQIFQTYAPISCHVQLGRDGRSRGYGIVTLQSNSVAVAAIQNMNNLSYAGRKLNVRFDQGKGAGSSKSRGVRGSGNGKKNASAQGRSVGGPQNRNYEATVYVGNLPWSTSWQELKDLFADYGPEYVDVKVGNDGRSRGWGTVRFADMASAESAIAEMNGTEIEGRNGVRQIEVRKDRGPTRN